MAGEFVDLYQVLDLPVDAEAGVVRKRLSERYLEAQRNLEHRNFATRVKFQEEFEVTLPQARYILLDDTRRAEYDRLVHAFRASNAPVSAAPTVAPIASAASKTGGFTLENASSNASSTAAGAAPAIEPLPPVPVDPAQLALEREELWKKWKSGLEAAISVETDAQPQPRSSRAPNVSAAPDSALISPAPDASPANAPPRATARPKIDISFNFGDQTRPGETSQSSGFTPEIAAPALTDAELEARRTQHRRQVTKEILVNVGLIWGIAGALIVLVPGFLALIAAVAHYYPRGGKALLKYPPAALWGGGFLLLGIASFLASTELSKAMRRGKARQLSLMSYEELLKQTVKS